LLLDGKKKENKLVSEQVRRYVKMREYVRCSDSVT